MDELKNTVVEDVVEETVKGGFNWKVLGLAGLGIAGAVTLVKVVAPKVKACVTKLTNRKHSESLSNDTIN